MQESLKNYMRVGLIHFMAFPSTMKGEGPIAETVRKIALDDYFDVIEITWIKDAAVRREVKAMLDCAHMTVGYGAQPRLLTQGLNINDLDEGKRRQAIATVKEGIDEAYEMGAVGLGYLSGPYQEATKQASFDALVASTGELCSYAKSKGNLNILLEIFDFDIDKKSIIGPTPLAKKFSETVRKNHANFGLLPDLSHLPLVRETPEQALVPIKEHILHAHMGNAVVKDKSMTAYGDQHPRFGFPNSANDVDELVEYLRVLIKVGYLNKKNPAILSFEVKPVGNEDPELVIANAKRTLNQAWAKL
jgi:sugar phosphate isomerase/epimerase